MSKTYSATGINLKAQPFGESDRLLTILTREFGLIKAIAPGARKAKSSLGGRSELFVVNQLLIAKGRSLDRITQAETVTTYAGLSKNLGKLAASQYLAELVLSQALGDHQQEDLFILLNEHLNRLQTLSNSHLIANSTQIIACLTQGIFHLLALAGTAPQVQLCCLSQRRLQPNFTDEHWRVGFSIETGGIINLSEWTPSALKPKKPITVASKPPTVQDSGNFYTIESVPQPQLKINTKLTAGQLAILQHLAQPELLNPEVSSRELIWAWDWMTVERTLRQYTEYHLGCCIRSASLIDTFTHQFIIDPPF
ncbi:DNA repair protein RecO [Planktothrix agardhii]|jgi:DNA repair protein RecO (recombination protein O)|uniref:DNA repair protein RecO n=1 Tax=Planktothrix agardhii TaxID=1160 RepID=UPI001D0A8811|nr:DNA repair protein RecO [Planktothrix agardhii]MCF3605382.1 DNA repair protein RecO [Planktothrix agardhii 1033]MCB8779751.1 DNA repair protein RecO [Planktothrix agardhii 1031]MCF3572592.1 DNA repair protein RecO [Planktothrix agardhii 1805]MCF3573987.1 DNA repair protein RecO [Planktothrix agardhii 1812]MCF3582096.1 DNA repair protein RecO [Planktothrix agardhii 1811]